jgi:hypothetical protein
MGAVNYSGVFRNNNTAIDIVSVDSGFTVRGTLTPFTPPAACSLATLSGPFAYTLGGVAYPAGNIGSSLCGRRQACV